MKKVATMAAALALALCLAGCGSDASAEDPAASGDQASQDAEASALAEGREAATELTITVGEGEELVFENMYYGDILTVEGAGVVNFVNCGFEKGIDLDGTFGSRIIVSDGCEFAPDTFVWMLHEETEATIDDALPKVLTFGVPVELAGESMGAIVAVGMDSVTFNGETYTIDGCELTLSEAGDSFVEIDPSAEYDSISVARWWENGEEVFVVYAFKA
ncbi:MAG: hypothetical protein IJO87_01190 [Eggerthellaceae bacterium]|nr:hypothetical protein [Eggerthellaceae bacterium]